MRRIIHIDQDCFYASVEMRDNPSLKGIPLGIAGLGRRSVLTTCNYEARAFGCHSAMPTFKAIERCPNLRLIAPDFKKYQEVSNEIRKIFNEYTEQVEPLSLDEAYLDVSANKVIATEIAQEIRERIQKEIGLTSSAGIGPNKMLAKIASDWHKPNGQFEIFEEQVAAFMHKLPVRKLWGVGPKTEKQLIKMGIHTCGDMQLISSSELIRRFGKFGAELYNLAQGKDERSVQPHRERKSISVERTFGDFITGFDTASEKLKLLYEELNYELLYKDIYNFASGIFVKIKFSDFSVTSVSKTGSSLSLESFFALLDKGIQRNSNPIRLLGLGVRLHSVINKSLQLDFIEVLDPANKNQSLDSA